MADDQKPEDMTAEERAERLKALLDQGKELSEAFETKAADVDRHLDYLEARSKVAETARANRRA